MSIFTVIFVVSVVCTSFSMREVALFMGGICHGLFILFVLGGIRPRPVTKSARFS